MDDYIWQVFVDSSHLSQVTGTDHLEMLGDVSLSTGAHGGSSTGCTYACGDPQGAAATFGVHPGSAIFAPVYSIQ